jgi:hypothetical protein
LVTYEVAGVAHKEPATGRGAGYLVDASRANKAEDQGVGDETTGFGCSKNPGQWLINEVGELATNPCEPGISPEKIGSRQRRGGMSEGQH